MTEQRQATLTTHTRVNALQRTEYIRGQRSFLARGTDK